MHLTKSIGKKGIVVSWFTLIDLLLVLVVIFIAFKFVDDVVEDIGLYKRVVAERTALLEDKISSIPGDLDYSDPFTPFWFSISYKRNKVEVFEGLVRPFAKASITTSYYIRNPEITYPYITLVPKKEVESTFSLASLFVTNRPKIKPGTFIKPHYCKKGDEITVDQEVKC